LQSELARMLSWTWAPNEASDRACAEQWVRDFAELFAAHGVIVTRPLAWRVEDVLACYEVVRRIEGQMWRAGVYAAPEEAPHAAPGPLAPCVEAAGKARERWRKAMKELEEYCAKVGTPIDVSLGEKVKGLMKKGAGVAEDAYEFETGKKPTAKKGAKRRRDSGVDGPA